MNNFIVDVQGFQKSKSDFIVKELAILEVQDSSLPLVFTFEPPTSWSNLSVDEKCTARWLETSFHGIRWSWGSIPYDQLSEVIHKYLSNSGKIFVKGDQKKKILQKILPESRIIIDLENVGCPALRKLNCTKDVFCCNHKDDFKSFICAVQNVHKLKSWIEEKKMNIEDVDEGDCGCNKNYVFSTPFSFFS